MGAMKSLHTHRILGTSPPPPVPADARGQWQSLIRIHAILCNRDPNRLRERPPDPPRYWSGSGPADGPEPEPSEPTMTPLFSDPGYVGPIRQVLLKLHGIDREPDPELVHACAVEGLTAGRAAARIAAAMAPQPPPPPEPERPPALMEWVEMGHSGRSGQARLF